jgi:hypothetical protein
MPTGDESSNRHEEPLFRALAEQLKAPLIQIANDAELSQHAHHPHADALAQIRQTANQTLKFIDAYLLSRQQQVLALESVSISAVLYDAAELLRPMARQQGGDLEVIVDGRYGPVMAHRQGLQTALVTLGQSLLQADSSPRPRLTMALYRTPNGLATGVFGSSSEWEAAALRKALDSPNNLFGQKSQEASLGGTGLQIARDIVQRMSSELQVTHHHKLTGLVAHFQPSAQLQLV